MPDRLANYVPVAERVTQAQDELIAVDADAPVMLTDRMGYIRVAVYLSDGRKATGTASFILGLEGRSAQATNPIEDCETSAVGRALAFLGFSSNRSIASREEVKEADRRAKEPASYHPPASPPSRVKLVRAVRAVWKEEKDLGGKAPAGELAYDLDDEQETPNDRLIELGKAARARVNAIKAARAEALKELETKQQPA